VKIKIEVEVSDQRAGDLLCSAFEGGSNYWYFIEQVSPSSAGAYYHEKPFDHNGWVKIRTLEHEEVNGQLEWLLDRAACERGLTLMAEKYPTHWSDFISENDDATTGDVYLQCCIFGEVVYG